MTSGTASCAAVTNCADFSPKADGGAQMNSCAGTRTGDWLTDGHRLLVWEYPRQAPDGDQVDLVEFMEIVGGLIAYHRIYWGWKGCTLIAPVLSRRGSGRRTE